MISSIAMAIYNCSKNQYKSDEEIEEYERISNMIKDKQFLDS